MKIWIACGLALALLACGEPAERPKFHIKRAKDYEPIVPPEAPSTATLTATVPDASTATIVEGGRFNGICDHSFTSINESDLVALANAEGMKNYRLAGIAIPPASRIRAHDQIRDWLQGEAIGIEIEGHGDGLEPAAYLYRCKTKSMLNADLARAGLAVVADTPSMHREALNAASMEALTAGRGVWGRK